MTGWPELAPAALHGLAGEVVAAISPETEADPAALLATFLVGFGNAVGRGPHARVGGAQHPARLNAVVVGDTARSRKGTSWADMKQILISADANWGTTRIHSGFGSGEAVIDAVCDAAPDASGPSDHRLLIREGEFARVMKAAGREGSTLGAIIRDAWDGGKLQSRSVSRGVKSAADPHISVLAHITREELEREIGSVDIANGFANRFLWVCARRARKLPSGGNLDAQVTGDLAYKVAERLERARTAGTLHRTPAAEERWAAWYTALNDDERGAYAAITARADAQALRLSVTYALLGGSRTIDVEHLDAALAFWQYCDNSARLLFGTLTGDKLADRILTALRAAAPAGLDGTQVHAALGRSVEAKRITDARGLLIDLELAEMVKVPSGSGGGRPREVLFAAEVSSVNSVSSVPTEREMGEEKYEVNEETALRTRDTPHTPYEETEETEETSTDLTNPTEPDWFTLEAAELANHTAADHEPAS